MKKSRLQQVSMEVTVGFFMFMVLLALGVFTIILSRQNIFTKTYHHDIVFDNIMELNDGDNVMVRGLDVGQVKALRLGEDGIHVKISITEKLDFREDYKVEILMSSVLGGRYVRIYEGSEEAPPVPTDATLRGTEPVNFIQELTRTVEAVRAALQEGGILENLQVTMQQMREVSDGIAQSKGTLGKLVNDDAMYENLTRITDNLKGISERLAKGEGSLGRLLSEDDALYESLASFAEAADQMANRMNEGEGTLGKLTGDEELYTEVLALIKDARATLDDLRETAPAATFTSVFFGAL